MNTCSTQSGNIDHLKRPYSPARVSTIVLIPCHNEQGRIGEVIKSIKDALPDADVAVIDDCSSDNSAAEAATHNVRLLSHCSNLGYGAALETGYMYAVKHGYDIVLQMDGDGQHLASQLNALIQPLKDDSADIVIGSRYKSGSDANSTTVVRKLGHKMFGAIIYLLSGLKISDPTSGFQGLNKSAVALFASCNFPCDYPDSDVILMARMAGLRVREVPAVMQARAGGESMHSGLKPVYYGIKMLLSIFIVLLNANIWRTWKKRHLKPTATSGQ